MKKSLFLLFFLWFGVAQAQLSVQNPSNGGIVISPSGIFGKYNTSYVVNNVAYGYETLSSNSSGSLNTAIGYLVLEFNTTGFNNTATGANALRFNTEGFKNTAVGTLTLFNNTFGSNNTATGFSALTSNTEGVNNTAVGESSLLNNLLGSNNTAIGRSSLAANLSGGNNTFIGAYADATGNFNNSTAIGANVTVDASNKVRIGNNQVTVIEGQVAWSYPSDRRLKESIIYNSQLGLNFITKLQPVSYNYISDKTKIRHDGFIAQDVEKAMQDLGIQFSGLKKSQDGTYSLAYSDFVMPLVNAVKEQQIQIEDLKKQYELLVSKVLAIDELKAEIEKLKLNNKESKAER